MCIRDSFWQSQNFIFDQLIGLIKGFDHLVGFRMEIDFIKRFGFGRVPDSTFQDILVDTCAIDVYKRQSQGCRSRRPAYR